MKVLLINAPFDIPKMFGFKSRTKRLVYQQLGIGYIAAGLEKAGHTVVGQATDGISVCQMYNQLKPDLVTMDITMPGMNGIEAMLKILESDPHAKIIMITAIDQKRMILDAIESGARHYIIKPFKEDKVLYTVNEVLKQD